MPQLEKGSLLLIEDLKSLKSEVEAGEFGDYTNTKYATPKVALRNRFLELAENVVKGKYD